MEISGSGASGFNGGAVFIGAMLGVELGGSVGGTTGLTLGGVGGKLEGGGVETGTGATGS